MLSQRNCSHIEFVLLPNFILLHIISKAFLAQTAYSILISFCMHWNNLVERKINVQHWKMSYIVGRVSASSLFAKEWALILCNFFLNCTLVRTTEAHYIPRKKLTSKNFFSSYAICWCSCVHAGYKVYLHRYYLKIYKRKILFRLKLGYFWSVSKFIFSLG